LKIGEIVVSESVVTEPSKFPGGSSWRKWDLHVHSPLSILNNQFTKAADGQPDWDAYITTLEATDYAVLGITDYFTIEGYKKVLEFKLAGRLPSVYTVLPNIEFRLKTIVANRKGGEIRLNLHVIFSEEMSPQEIEEHFLHDISFYFEGDPQSGAEKRKLKISNLEALGKELQRQHESFKLMSAIECGATQAVVDADELMKILTRDSRFRGKFLVILPASGWDDINWEGQGHLVRKSLLQMSDIVMSSNQKTRKWCLGLPPYMEGPEKFRDEFSTLKPCIHGSDAHSIEQFGNHCILRGETDHSCIKEPSLCDHRFCWIKADPTFEGLKQLLYEPQSRVSIQASDPTPVKSNSCIKAFRFDGSGINDELSIQAANLPLSPGLVAVTGGKGAGKTALVDLLANLFRDRCNTEDQNSFVRRITADKASFSTAITFGDSSLFEKKLDERKFVEQSEVVYIAQGELELHIGESSDLDDYIRKLIFESRDVKDTVKVFEFEKLAKRIRELESDIVQKNDIIEKLESVTAASVLAATNREKIQTEAELRDLASRIPDVESRLSKEKVGVVETKEAARSALRDRKLQLIEVSELVGGASLFVKEDLSRFNSYSGRIARLLQELQIEAVILPELSYSGVTDLLALKDRISVELDRTVSEIERSEKELRGFASEMQEHAHQLNRRSELSARLKAIQSKQNALTLDLERLAGARKERSETFRALLRTALTQQLMYSDIIALFATNKAAVLSDLDFTAQIHFAETELLKQLEEILDNRQVEVFGDERVPSRFEELRKFYGYVAEGDAVGIEQTVAETDVLCDELRLKIKASRAIKRRALYDCLYARYLTVVPVVKYKKTALNRLSLGKKATVLIKIYLAQGTNPIIIDSHDDHLDNEFIMDELVGAIRQAKEFRQVILASNNGNVVINSDAEQIIIARRESGKISYDSGSIENPSIRDRALCVLEGGAEAFKKRREKYRLPT
jgi:energy-coupling factor transporter ATP-binding protein EcfA2